jgi:hypothetical protein
LTSPRGQPPHRPCPVRRAVDPGFPSGVLELRAGKIGRPTAVRTFFEGRGEYWAYENSRLVAAVHRTSTLSVPFWFDAHINYSSMTTASVASRTPFWDRGILAEDHRRDLSTELFLLVREWPQAGLVPNSAVFSLAMPTSTAHIGLAAPYGGLVSP